ncbi:vitelline membrane protein Vm34Ca-like [Neocloeon triangulifer]|uniref:vitelline membrane protein Vm34Ca-like n=1 Tax=Neocloeon triangulifer TaxID=2078957 RepID=UPI00286EE849|nr:vitelline membrane protein Vm34Ca-like [Neocloeon triangulifer]
MPWEGPAPPRYKTLARPRSGITSLASNQHSATMYKLFVLAAVLAVAAAGNILPYPYAGAYAGYAAHPLAYSANLAAPYAYSAPIAAPVAYSAAAPLAYSAAAIPAPVAYTSGYKVSYATEPVEQHGYKIAY